MLACAALVAAAGCATVDSVKEARGQGIKRTYRQPYELVYQAALKAASGRKLQFVEQDAAAGRLVLSHGATWGSLGERIAVFVTRLGERSTSVEIVARAVFTPLNFPPDWPALLFGDIEAELAAAPKAR